LDLSAANWKILLVISALMGLSSVYFQMRVDLSKEKEAEPPLQRNKLTHPLNECFRLIRERPDFAHFQWGFMFGGFSLMLMAPALSIFYVDTLQLSHASVAVARLILMGIGVAGSSFLWKKGLSRIGLNRLIVWVLVGFGLFSLSLLTAQLNLFFFYLAFLLYGIAQAGSHLIWNLSGTIFSGEQDSSPFTTVNVLMVGLRGLVGPILGGILCELLGPIPVLAIGGVMALLGGAYMYKYRQQNKLAEEA
jgi:predicted MFS family arabinose efflux permease